MRRADRDLLASSMGAFVPLRIRRRGLKKADVLDGLALRMTDHWLLSAVLDDGPYLDGFEVVRLSDVTHVSAASPESIRYLLRGVEGTGQWPVSSTTALALAALDLRTARSILESVPAASPLVGIQCEKIVSDEIYIGEVVRVGRKKVRLLDIGLNGEWSSRPRAWKLADVTRIQFGDRYQRALADFGDPRPLRQPEIDRPE